MKILTKEWMEQYEQVMVINWLKEFDANKISFEEIQKISRDNFYDGICDNRKLAKLAFGTSLAEDLYKARVDRDSKALSHLPKEIYSRIKDIKSVVLGYACKEDKEMLAAYADKLCKKLEKQAQKSNRITGKAQKHLAEQFDFDFLMGELAYEEYVEGKNYFIVVDGYTICVENYVVVEREDLEINGRDVDNPESLWTSLDAMELHHTEDNFFELHMLFTNEDKLENKTLWYFTLKGTNVKFA